jgi:hypothetical protein
MEHVERPRTIVNLDTELLVPLPVRHGHEQVIVDRFPEQSNLDAVVDPIVEFADAGWG